MNGKGKDDIVAKYKVEGFPTSYLLDSRGRITARFLGEDEAGLKVALRKLGLRPR